MRRGRLSRRDVLRYAATVPAVVGLIPLTTSLTPGVATASSVAGRIVFLDPGHNGANDASISRQVPTGRGGTKDLERL